jgi:hypothetical protein
LELQAVRDELRLKQSEIWQEFDSNPPSELLHFTSTPGFEGIMRSGELWCADIRNVNDSREGDHGMDIIRIAVAKRPFSLPENFRKWIRAPYFSGLFGLKDSYTVYISCFSVGPADGTMWNDYADTGRGCAIVFDYNILATGQDDGKKYSLFPVLYDREKQIENAGLTLDHAATLSKTSKFEAQESNRYWFNEVPFALSVCALRFKGHSWQKEKEMRIYVAGGDNITPFSAPDGRQRVAVPFPKEAILRIERPLSANLSIDEIRAVLKKYGYPENLPIVEQ